MLSPKAISQTTNFFIFWLWSTDDNIILIILRCFVNPKIGLHLTSRCNEGPAINSRGHVSYCGVFLVIRCSILFENSNILFVVALFGALTASSLNSRLVINDLGCYRLFNVQSTWIYGFFRGIIKLFNSFFSFSKSCFIQSVVIPKCWLCYSRSFWWTGFKKNGWIDKISSYKLCYDTNRIASLSWFSLFNRILL